jgi:hypothetical protein
MVKGGHLHLNLLRGRFRVHHPPMARWKQTLIGVGLSLGLVATGYTALLLVGFYAVRLHVTDVAGVVDPNSDAYNAFARSLLNIPLDQLRLPNTDSREDGLKKFAAAQDRCQLAVVRQTYPLNADRIVAAQAAGADHETIAKMIFAVQLRAQDAALSSALNSCFAAPNTEPGVALTLHTNNVFPWVGREEWGVAASGFSKDANTIKRAATTIGIEPRTIISAGFVEQMRLYFTQREVYEKFFRPLKILGTATQFAWGVMAIKEATAIDVERHLHDPRSSYYLGPSKEHALDFTATDQTAERFARLTNEKDHLYSYLYGGFELAQFIAQWKRAGFDIARRPEILATLYNIGFSRSKPNANPQVGGSTLTIADTEYTFGALAFEFYYSGELLDVFPYTVPSS